jgi:tellurite resistance protein TehA-like permease
VRLGLDGDPAVTAALAAAAAVAWLALSYAMPVGLATASASPGDVNGTWFLWVVGTQSLVLLAVSLSGPHGLARSPAWSGALTFAATALWCCGAILYLVILVLVLARVLVWRLRPADATPDYWIVMGAAAITVLAGAQLLHSSATPVLRLLRPMLAGSSLALWAFASWLIPLLAALAVWRHARGHMPLRYHGDLWAAIFPAGMYATASMRLGQVTAVPAITAIGRGAAWVAAVAWLVTFAALLAAKLPAVAARVR